MKYLVSGDFLTLMQIKNLKNLWMRTCFNSIHTLKHIRYSKNIQNILVVKLKRFKEITLTSWGSGKLNHWVSI